MAGGSKKNIKKRQKSKQNSPVNYSWNDISKVLEDLEKLEVEAKELGKKKKRKTEGNMATALMKENEEADTSNSEGNMTADLCGYCKTYVRDGIFCDRCGTWFHYHIDCSGIESAQAHRRTLQNRQVQ